MKNLKKLLAVIVSICVLATFAVPAFAETKTEIQICQDLGMVQGTTGGVTDAYKASTPARYQAAIMFLRLKGLEDEATAFIPTENFSDLKGLNETNKAILGYLKANPELGFEGIGNNKFDPLKPITAKEYYKVLLTALGYKEGTDFTWANAMQFAASKGLYALVDNTKFTINDMAIATVEGLKATVKGGTDTLIAALVDAGAITAEKATATGLYTAVPKALTVVSATADTLKTAKIVFNKELDKDTIVKANFSNSKVTTDPVLLDDKKTVVVVLNTAESMSASEDIVIDNVKSTDGVKIAKITEKVTFVDNTIPTITGLTVKNAKALVLSASEPLNADYSTPQMFNDIKIDGNPMTASTSIDFGKNTITFNLTSLLAKGTHTVSVAKLADYAGYVAVAQTYTIDVPEDTTAPVVTSAKLNNINEVEVTFNEDIGTNGSFRINDVDVTNAAIQTNKAVFKLAAPRTLDIGAVVEVKVSYKGQKDVVGNEVKDWTNYTFKVTDDTTLPTVTAAIDSANKITLTFSKSMLTSAGKVTVYKDDGTTKLGEVALAGHWKSDTNNTVAEIAANLIGADSDLNTTNPKAIVVKVTGCKDATVRTNSMVDASFTLNANDTKHPVIMGNYKITPDANNHDNDTITFYFTEAMDNDTLKNLSNYVLVSGASGSYTDDQTFAAQTPISFSSIASNNMSVTFKAKGISALTTPTFKVYPVKDLAGNYSTTTAVDTAVSGSLGITGAVATGDKKIEVTFNQNIASFDPSVFVVRQGLTDTSTWVAFVTSYSIADSKVTLNLSDSMGTTTEGSRFIVSQNENLVKDVYGRDLGSVTVASTLTDNIKPTAKVATGDATGELKITFSEPVVLTGLVPTDIKVYKNSDGSWASAATVTPGANTIVIGGLTSGTEYKVTIDTLSIRDQSGVLTNTLASFSGTATAK